MWVVIILYINTVMHKVDENNPENCNLSPISDSICLLHAWTHRNWSARDTDAVQRGAKIDVRPAVSPSNTRSVVV